MFMPLFPELEWKFLFAASPVWLATYLLLFVVKFHIGKRKPLPILGKRKVQDYFKCAVCQCWSENVVSMCTLQHDLGYYESCPPKLTPYRQDQLHLSSDYFLVCLDGYSGLPKLTPYRQDQGERDILLSSKTDDTLFCSFLALSFVRALPSMLGWIQLSTTHLICVVLVLHSVPTKVHRIMLSISLIPYPGHVTHLQA